jgi:hypothetical protein
MTIQRPDWSGGLPALATPTPEQVIHEVATQSQPSEATRRAFADDAPATTAPVPAKRGIDGIMRQDWDKARNESGQFVSKTEGEMRAQWDKEGGFAHVAQVVTAKEQTMYSAAPSLEAKVTEHLDRGFLMKAADHLRLGVSYGPTGLWDSVARFENSLSPSERDAWGKFCRSLNEDEQAALIYGMSK